MPKCGKCGKHVEKSGKCEKCEICKKMWEKWGNSGNKWKMWKKVDSVGSLIRTDLQSSDLRPPLLRPPLLRFDCGLSDALTRHFGRPGVAHPTQIVVHTPIRAQERQNTYYVCRLLAPMQEHPIRFAISHSFHGLVTLVCSTNSLSRAWLQ